MRTWSRSFPIFKANSLTSSCELLKLKKCYYITTWYLNYFNSISDSHKSLLCRPKLLPCDSRLLAPSFLIHNVYDETSKTSHHKEGSSYIEKDPMNLKWLNKPHFGRVRTLNNIRSAKMIKEFLAPKNSKVRKKQGFSFVAVELVF